MKKFLYIIMTIILCFCTFINTYSVVFASPDEDTALSWPESPEINGEAAILIEASTGTILYEKNAYNKMYPASITKILTGILAVENCELDDVVTFSSDAVNLVSDAANIECKAGEELSVKDCLYALLLASANEVATALAEHIAGSVDSFADMMNEWAAEAGATDSHFTNANGLHDDNHYITAYDMSMITRRAIQNSVFCSVTGTCEYIIAPTNKTEDSRELNNRHKMVWSEEYSSVAYDGVFGGKTGYTDQAGTTLVTYARRDGMTLICVVLNSNSYNVYYDTATLFDYGFNNFGVLNISESETMFGESTSGLLSLTSIFSEYSPMFSISEDDYIVLPKTASFDDAVSSVSFDNLEDGEAARLQYYYADKLIGSASVLSLENVSVDTDDTITAATKEDEAAVSASASINENSRNDISLIRNIIIALAVLVIAIVIFIFIKRKMAILNDTRAQKRTRYR